MYASREVLIVEDETSLQTTVEHIIRLIDPKLSLIDPKLSTVWVKSAEKAMSLLRHRKFELIVADYLLAGPRTGIDLWHMCRLRHAEVPFVMISGIGVLNFLNLTEGFSARPLFLSKPFRPIDIQEALSDLLKHHKRKNVTVSHPGSFA
jgi:DNA-binding NtrC family response regulator